MMQRRFDSARQFGRLWLSGLRSPRAGFDAIGTMPGARLGATAVLVRFAITALTEMLPLARLRRRPFSTPRLVLGRSAVYDARDITLLPVFGFAVWGLMSAVAHASLRLLGRPARFGQVLNVIGMGMLIPMPVLWAWDWLAIARNAWQPVPMAISHALVELWEAALFAVGLKRLFGVRPALAAVVGLLLGGVYVLAARLVIR